MLRILKLTLVVFVIVCITGCPPPNYTDIIGSNEVGRIRMELKGSCYKASVFEVNHVHYNEQKFIFFDMLVSNTSGDTLTMICSKSAIYSKTDTFSWRNLHEYYKNNSAYEFISDTVKLKPHGFAELNMLFVGKKNYSNKLYRKSNKEDTLLLRLNLFDKDTAEIRMQNHSDGGPIWRRY
jgi:hypothetical protein